MTNQVPPVVILRQQAGLLGERTSNLLLAEVTTVPRNGHFIHHFFLVAPALSDYRYQLFYIRQGIEFYPLEIYADPKPPIQVDSEEQFLKKLRTVLGSKETKRVVGSLLAKSIDCS